MTDVPPECGTGAELELSLRRHLGPQVPLDTTHVVIRRASFEPSPGPASSDEEPSAPRPVYRLSVQVGAQTRKLEDDDCRELFRAAIVVAVAMLVPDKSPESPKAEVAAPAPSAPSAPSARASSPRPLFGAAFGAGLSFGTAPPPVLALELEGKLAWRRWGVSTALRYAAPGSRRDAEDLGVTVQALGASLSGFWRAPPYWEVKLGLNAYRLFGEGLGSTNNTVGAAWALGPALGLTFAPLQAAPFWGGFGAEGQWNALRGRFEIDDYGEVFQMPHLAASGFLRAGVLW